MEVSWLCKEVPHLVTCKPLWRGPQSQAQPVSIAPQDIEMSGRGQFSEQIQALKMPKSSQRAGEKPTGTGQRQLRLLQKTGRFPTMQVRGSNDSDTSVRRSAWYIWGVLR